MSTATEPTTDVTANKDPESDLSGLDDDDDDDPALSALQASRLSELKKAAQAAQSKAGAATASSGNAAPNGSTSTSTSTGRATGSSASAFATLHAYQSEKAAMQDIASAPLAVLLFTHADFPLCGAMASHLSRIASLTAGSSSGSSSSTSARTRAEQDNVLWLSLDAEAAPFLTNRLRVRVLPCVVGYARGEEAGRLVGFEGLGRRAQAPGGPGWKRVAAVLQGWGILGQGVGAVDDDDDDEDDSNDSEDDEADGDGNRGGNNRSGRQTSWIGGQRMNTRTSIRGTASKTKRGGSDDDDDWD